VKIALVGKGGSGKTTLSGLIGLVGRSGYVRAAERGAAGPLSALEPATREVLDRMRAATDATPRDWAAYTRQAVTAWANDRSGVDLSAQVDPDFTLGLAALEACPPPASALLGAPH
jgi:CO dehydrogenase maturation factor